MRGVAAVRPNEPGGADARCPPAPPRFSPPWAGGALLWLLFPSGIFSACIEANFLFGRKHVKARGKEAAHGALFLLNPLEQVPGGGKV